MHRKVHLQQPGQRFCSGRKEQLSLCREASSWEPLYPKQPEIIALKQQSAWLLTCVFTGCSNENVPVAGDHIHENALQSSVPGDATYM